MNIDQETYAPGLKNRIEIYLFMLFDGVIIEKNNISICDLRFFMDEYRHWNKPMIQINTKESSEIYHNPKKAIERFWSLING